MPPKLDLSSNNSQDQRQRIYIEKQRFSFVSGVIMWAALEALHTGDTTKVKMILVQLGFLDPEMLIDAELGGIKPFRDFKPHNILRFPDEVREQSLLDDSSETLDGECPCEVSFYGGEVYIRWTLPRPEFILKCNSPKKLAHLALVAIEELMHIRQIIGPNVRAINTLSTLYEFDAVKSTGHMEEQDQQLLAAVLETDITLFFDKYLSQFKDLQWFTDRHNADDYHKTLTPEQFIDAIMYLCDKYGYIEEVKETILDEIFNAVEFNPHVGLPMLLAPSLYRNIDNKTMLVKFLELLGEYPEFLEDEIFAPMVAAVLKKLADNADPMPDIPEES